MNRDGSGVLHSEHESSDTNTSSLNNSLSEEEFSIESSNLDSGGLKLTISCRRKSCDNEVDDFRAVMSHLPLHSSDESSKDCMEKDCQEPRTGEKYLQSTPQVDVNSSDVEIRPEGYACTDDLPSNNAIVNSSVGKLSSESGHTKKLSSSDVQPVSVVESSNINCEPVCISDVPQNTIEEFQSKEFSLPLESEVTKPQENVKVTKRGKVLNHPHVPQSQDVQDNLLRLDTLPNVSPDSGIISLDESPFGNESPNSGANGETSVDSHHGTLPSSVASASQQSDKKRDPLDNTDPLSHQLSEQLNKKETHMEVGTVYSHSDETVHDSRRPSKESNSLNAALPYPPQSGTTQTAETVCAISSVTNNASDTSSRVSPLPCASGIIVSSPHKINQTSGRKKRGRPPKTKKTLLLKHKKSMLYSSVFDREAPPCDTIETDTAGEREEKKGSIRNDSVDVIMCRDVRSSDACFEPVKIGTGRSADKVAPLSGKRRVLGRPKGSLGKKKIAVLGKETFPHKIVENKDKSAGQIKRPRGRPRKNPVPVQDFAVGDISVPVAPMKVKPKMKRKCGRKKFFTQRKKRTVPVQSQQEAVPLVKEGNTLKKSPYKKAKLSQVGSTQAALSSSSRISKDLSVNTESSEKVRELPEKSLFQDKDKDFDALLKSVKSSIDSQFPSEEENHEVVSSLSFDNPFKVAHPPPFPKVPQPALGKPVKTKAKRPKLHVMMRRTKRKKKKKPLVSKPPSEPAPPLKKLGMFSTVSPQRRFGKFSSAPPEKSVGMFGSGTSQKRLSFFTSRVQPSKILASSRLNVFRLGTGVETQHRSTDMEHSDGSDRKGRKRHRLLYRKSKHKNIIDPVFAAELDMLIKGLGHMAVSENQADNFIRVRPGEMPLPSIFRVIRIDVNRKPKERPLQLDTVNMDKSKLLKTRKETPSPYDVPSSTAFKPIGSNRSIRKKSSSDVAPEQQDSSYISDSSDQWLPPKKRHRLVNIDATQALPKPSLLQNSSSAVEKIEEQTAANRRRARKSKKFGLEGSKQGDKMAPKGLGQQFVGQELTIDTSSYTTGGSTNYTPSPSSCPSRLSTRSSTLQSLSSPSPTGSSVAGRRHQSRSSCVLTCPVHSMSSSVEDKLTCVECQLLEQSLSPGVCRSRPNSSAQLHSGSSIPCDRLVSSCEPSPVQKTSQSAIEKSNTRGSRKRRKSSNLSGYDSDSSPPRLEKTTALSPHLYQDNEVFSEPPEITNSPSKTCLSPRKLATRNSLSCAESIASPHSLRNKDVVSPKRILRPSSFPLKSRTGSISCKTKLCNNRSSSGANKSATGSSLLSEYEPLPLDHCTKRKLVEEIKAAIASESSESSSSSDEDDNIVVDPSQPSSGQPPRKRFQRVGLFSDFYKDEEPRKRCENMVKCRDKLVYIKEEHEFGLMPQPVHIGSFYMMQVWDFQLPYDIWWQHQNQMLPKKPEMKTKFRNIRTNVYSDSKVSNRKSEVPLCNCKPPPAGGKGCLDDCLNRMIYTECSPAMCPMGENCGNQKIQKHEWAPGLEKFLTKDRGFGVRTNYAIKSSQFILEYLGEVISEVELRRRMMEEYSEECHHYALHLDSGCVIDGYRMGNIGRYVNHSCQPNCEMQKWNVNGLYRMVLFALRDIEAGEELSYDYNFDPFNQETQQECRCRSTECRGVIGGKTQRTNSIMNKPEKVLEDSKDKRKNKVMNRKSKDKMQPPENVPVLPMAKPMTLKERCYARKHRTFLVRNVDKVRNQRHPGQDLPAVAKEEVNPLDCGNIGTLSPDLMLAHLNERSIKTRLAAYAKDTPEMARRHRLAQIMDKMLTELLSLKDDDGDSLVTPLMSLPSRKKQPQYYQVVREPIDMSMIKQRVKTGYYDHLSSFNADVMLLFGNVEVWRHVSVAIF
ncbi:uncharacterized protein LOC101849998 isoform X2 [Aplysia californica]|uniref:Uncharacterized protein LOC101849998 isoform X2 n=1 Tax=Aplysia californica TaxID=6500 RepID=A0ABM1VR82_APLCA|nr:uncharacterized protein LOC101849998 isoform X2 [Aplysia californica]